MVNTFKYIIDKYKIEVGNQYIVDIPNMGRDNLAEVFTELGFNKGAEVGVFKGKYSEVLCKANPNLELYGVDAWRVDAHSKGVFTEDEVQLQGYFDKCYKETLRRMSPYPKYTVIKKLSTEAAKDFEDNSLDFVYIDAGHDFLNFTLDLHYWSRKVKVGGIVSGHDYARYPYRKYIHVKRVLEAYAWSYKMIPFFVIGSLEVREGEVRDRYRSWLWVKDRELP